MGVLGKYVEVANERYQIDETYARAVLPYLEYEIRSSFFSVAEAEELFTPGAVIRIATKVTDYNTDRSPDGYRYIYTDCSLYPYLHSIENDNGVTVVILRNME